MKKHTPVSRQTRRVVAPTPRVVTSTPRVVTRDESTNDPIEAIRNIRAQRDESADDSDEEYEDEDEYTDDESDEEYEDDSDEDESESIEEYTAQSYTYGQVIPMPSGKGLRLRPYSLLSAVERGELPNNLIDVARKMLYDEKTPVPRNHDERRAQRAQPQRKADTDSSTMGKLTDWLCCQMIASFKCVDKQRNEMRAGEVHVHDLFDADKVAIVQFAMSGQQQLRSFRR